MIYHGHSLICLNLSLSSTIPFLSIIQNHLVSPIGNLFSSTRDRSRHWVHWENRRKDVNGNYVDFQLGPGPNLEWRNPFSIFQFVSSFHFTSRLSTCPPFRKLSFQIPGTYLSFSYMPQPVVSAVALSSWHNIIYCDRCNCGISVTHKWETTEGWILEKCDGTCLCGQNLNKHMWFQTFICGLKF